MHSSARIFDNGTLQAFYPEVVERYIEYNPDYEPIADINPEMFDDIPLPAKDIIFAAIRAPPGFSTQDSIDYIHSSTEVVFRFRNFADIEAVIEPFVDPEQDPEMHFKAYFLFYCTIHGHFQNETLTAELVYDKDL